MDSSQSFFPLQCYTPQHQQREPYLTNPGQTPILRSHCAHPGVGGNTLEDKQGGLPNTPLLRWQRKMKTPRETGRRLRDVLSTSSFGLVIRRVRLWVGCCLSVSQAAPAGFVLLQVTHHGPAEQAGLSETLPLLKQRLHDVGDKTCHTAKAGRVRRVCWTWAQLQPPLCEFLTSGTCIHIMTLVCVCVLCSHLSVWLGQSPPAGYTEDWFPGQTFSPGPLLINTIRNYDLQITK